MSKFEEYQRKELGELRPVTETIIEECKALKGLIVMHGTKAVVVSISEADKEAGSPKIGDMIARNPKNHEDQWLVAAAYFGDNFEKKGDSAFARNYNGFLTERVEQASSDDTRAAYIICREAFNKLK